MKSSRKRVLDRMVLSRKVHNGYIISVETTETEVDGFSIQQVEHPTEHYIERTLKDALIRMGALLIGGNQEIAERRVKNLFAK